QTNRSVLNSLTEKGLVEIYDLQTSRIPETETEAEDANQLTLEQNQALKQIQIDFENDKPVLLKGVSSSGKTEIYIQLIKQKLEENKTILFLLPDISLTSQMVQRIKKIFGEIVGVYHSGFNQNERVELWNKTLKGEFKIILCDRYAYFLTFNI